MTHYTITLCSIVLTLLYCMSVFSLPIDQVWEDEGGNIIAIATSFDPGNKLWTERSGQVVMLAQQQQQNEQVMSLYKDDDDDYAEDDSNSIPPDISFLSPSSLDKLSTFEEFVWS